MNIRNMTIRHRFYFVTALILLILTVFGIYMVVITQQMAEINEKLFNHPLVVSNDAAYANSEVLRMQGNLMEILLVDEDYEINILADKIRISEGNVYAALETISFDILGEEGKFLQSQTQELFDEWKDIRTELINAARNGDKAKAFAIHEDQSQQHVEQLEQKFNEINSYARNKAEGFRRSSVNLAGLTVTLIVAGLLFAFMMISGAVFWMNRRILEGITQLSASLKDIVDNGEFKNVSLEGSDEFVSLSNVFNELLTTLSSQLWVKQGNQLLNNIFLDDSPFEHSLNSYVRQFNQYGDFLSVAYYGLEERTLSLTSVVNRMAFMQDEYTLGQFHIGECAESNAVKSIQYNEIEAYSKHELPFQSVMFLPVSLNEDVFGVLTVVFKNTASSETLELIEASVQDFASYVATAIQRRRINDLLEASIKANESLTDRQTELEENQSELESANNSLQEQRDLLNAKSNELSKQNHELVLLREELVEKYHDLEEVTKYRSQFLANVSHELRTPLNSILVLSNMLKEKELPDYTDKDTEKVQVINKAASELLKTINGILDLAKLENGKVELSEDLFQPSHLIAELKAIYEPMMIDKGLIGSFKARYDKAVYGDRSKIAHIITNFLSNAIKFTSAGEISVVFDTNNDPAFPLKIDVTDTGIGIETGKFEAIFDEFVQSDGAINRTYGGTGLGLSISKNYANLIGGRIMVASELDHGSTFTLLLPARAAEVSLSNEDPVLETGAASQEEGFTDKIQLKPEHLGKKILICDDEPMNVFSMSSMLEDIGAEPIAALSSSEAIAVHEAQKIDLILMDFMMPETDGVETLDKMSTIAKEDHLPVVIITAANLDPKDVENIYSKGYRLLKKPVDYNDIVNLLNDLL